MLDDEYSRSFLEMLSIYKLDRHEMILSAMRLAKRYHSGQFRKTGEVYYKHPISVAKTVLKYSRDTDTIAAALLHDIVEDTLFSLSQIQFQFNNTIFQIVSSLTDICYKKKLKKLSDEFVIYKRLSQPMQKPVLLIKAADRLDNLSSIDIFPIEKQILKVQDTISNLLPYIKLLNIAELEKEITDICMKILSNHQNP